MHYVTYSDKGEDVESFRTNSETQLELAIYCVLSRDSEACYD